MRKNRYVVLGIKERGRFRAARFLVLKRLVCRRI